MRNKLLVGTIAASLCLTTPAWAQENALVSAAIVAGLGAVPPPMPAQENALERAADFVTDHPLAVAGGAVVAVAGTVIAVAGLPATLSAAAGAGLIAAAPAAGADGGATITVPVVAGGVSLIAAIKAMATSPAAQIASTAVGFVSPIYSVTRRVFMPPYGWIDLDDLGDLIYAPVLAGRDYLNEARIWWTGDYPATFGASSYCTVTCLNWRGTFFDAHPWVPTTSWVHHAVERRALIRYPGVVTEEMIHSLENLRGIPIEVNNDIHLTRIKAEWDDFYATHPIATVQDLLDKATEIDRKFGSYFNPPVHVTPIYRVYVASKNIGWSLWEAGQAQVHVAAGALAGAV